MLEITTTRHNHLIDPILHAWTWQIPVYLFLGGLVAGMMIISGFFLVRRKYEEESCSCFYLPYISFILLSIGMLFLFLDLEHKLYVWRLYTTFQITSPMSWGAWILILVYPVLLANMMIRIPAVLIKRFPMLADYSKKVKENKSFINVIGTINIILGALVGMYTGILLSSLGARPFWNSAILWLLFLASGLSGAAALVNLISKNAKEKELLEKADNGFLILELFVIVMMIISLLTSSKVHVHAVQLILNGPLAAAFWVFVVGMGIVIPLFLQLLAVNKKIHHTPVAPVMVIVGGLILRFIIVSAGQLSHWF